MRAGVIAGWDDPGAAPLAGDRRCLLPGVISRPRCVRLGVALRGEPVAGGRYQLDTKCTPDADPVLHTDSPPLRRKPDQMLNAGMHLARDATPPSQRLRRRDRTPHGTLRHPGIPDHPGRRSSESGATIGAFNLYGRLGSARGSGTGQVDHPQPVLVRYVRTLKPAVGGWYTWRECWSSSSTTPGGPRPHSLVPET